MPRLAIILGFAIWGLAAGDAPAQTSSRLPEYDDLSASQAPLPPQRIPDDSGWAVPITGKTHAVTNQEMSVRDGSQVIADQQPLPQESPENANVTTAERSEVAPMPMAVPLPVPLPPPKLDESVKPVSYQANDSAEESRLAESDMAAADDKSMLTTSEKTPLTPQINKAKIPLAPSSKAAGSNAGKSTAGLPSMISIAGSTGLVLGIFLLLVWIVRRKTPQAMVRLPGEAFEILGRAPLGGRQQVQLLRCGSRLLLVSVTPGGAETLTEIIDPAEVDRLAGLCRQAQPGSSSAAFKQIFEQLAPRRPGRSEYCQHDQEEYEMTDTGYRRGSHAWEDRHV